MPDLPFDVPLLVTVLDRISLVDRFLSPANTELEFDDTAFQIEFERNESKAAFIDLSLHTLQLLFMDKQLPFSIGIVVENVAMSVWSDMKTDEPEFAVFYPAVGVGKRELTGFHRFYFGAFEFDTALKAFVDFVIETGFSIVRKELGAGIVGCHYCACDNTIRKPVKAVHQDGG